MCVCVRTRTCTMAYMPKLEDSFYRLFVSFYSVDSRVQTPVVRLGSKYLYSLRHLDGTIDRYFIFLLLSVQCVCVHACLCVCLNKIIFIPPFIYGSYMTTLSVGPHFPLLSGTEFL